ncbi:4125_t:CDS:2, partial [Cetraspora pellucida]
MINLETSKPKYVEKGPFIVSSSDREFSYTQPENSMENLIEGSEKSYKLESGDVQSEKDES